MKEAWICDVHYHEHRRDTERLRAGRASDERVRRCHADLARLHDLKRVMASIRGDPMALVPVSSSSASYPAAAKESVGG